MLDIWRNETRPPTRSSGCGAALQRIADDGKNCQDHCRNQARRALEPKKAKAMMPRWAMPLALDTVLPRRRRHAGRHPHRLPDAAADMSGDVVVLVTAIAVLVVALIGAALVSWWVWQGW